MPKKNKVGHPLTYTPEMGEEICRAVSTTSESLVTLCKNNPHWPHVNTIYEWRIKVKEFGDKYTKAKQNQVEVLVDEILTIADNEAPKDYTINEEGKLVYNGENVARSRLRIDTRKWFACKLAPKLYGDKVSSELNVNMKHEDALKEIARRMEIE